VNTIHVKRGGVYEMREGKQRSAQSYRTINLKKDVTLMKKIITICLLVAMIFAIGISAIADEAATPEVDLVALEQSRLPFVDGSEYTVMEVYPLTDENVYIFDGISVIADEATIPEVDLVLLEQSRVRFAPEIEYTVMEVYPPTDGNVYIFDAATRTALTGVLRARYLHTEEADIASSRFVTVTVSWWSVPATFVPPSTMPFTEDHGTFLYFGILSLVPGTFIWTITTASANYSGTITRLQTW